MKLGKRAILRVLEIVKNSDFDNDKKQAILDLISPFLTKTEQLDLMTICRIEVMTGQTILYVPTKQQLRKLKLDKLNKIIDDNKNK